MAIHDLGGLGDEDAHGNHRAFSDDHALDHFGPCADEAIVFDDGRVRLQRFKDASNAGAGRDMAILADLRARADGGPGVDHCAFADIGADVHIGRHQDRILRNEGAAAHSGRGHRTKARGLEFG